MSELLYLKRVLKQWICTLQVVQCAPFPRAQGSRFQEIPEGLHTVHLQGPPSPSVIRVILPKMEGVPPPCTSTVYTDEPGLATSTGFFQIMFHARHALRTKPASDLKRFTEALESFSGNDTRNQQETDFDQTSPSQFSQKETMQPKQSWPNSACGPPKKVIIIGPVNGLPSTGGASKNHWPPGGRNKMPPSTGPGVLCTCPCHPMAFHIHHLQWNTFPVAWDGHCAQNTFQGLVFISSSVYILNRAPITTR